VLDPIDCVILLSVIVVVRRSGYAGSILKETVGCDFVTPLPREGRLQSGTVESRNGSGDSLIMVVRIFS